METKLITWVRVNNLNGIINFHKFVKNLLKDQLYKLEQTGITDINSKISKDVLHEYDRIQNVNTMLMMYSYLEEWLYHFWKIYAHNIAINYGRSSLERFKKVTRHLGVNLNLKIWGELKDTEKVRNCLLHANGRISLLEKKKKNEIESIVKKNKDNLIIKEDHIQISYNYLECFNKNISGFLDNITSEAERLAIVEKRL